MTERRIVIAGTGSGVGKTTITIGLMAALQKKGYVVQGFKCGPDYIDPTYHTAVTGRNSRNLDSWMLNEETVKGILVNGSKGADISIIEGVMGFYDGKDPRSDKGSTADISILTNSPVILVVNCSSMARSAAAIVKGFQCLSEEVNVVGVIANRVGSIGHFSLVKTAIEQECQVPVIGYLQRESDIEMPERHLGLVPSIERGELDDFFNQLGDLILENIDIDKLLEISKTEPLEIEETFTLLDKKEEKACRIAVAKDAAFNFYYQENIELLEAFGAEIVYFSPLAGEVLPENIDGLYLGGGFPEEFVDELSSHDNVKQSIKTAIQSGMPTLAECGGFMYLTEAIETTSNEEYEMVGIIPGKVTMQIRLAALGYREITGKSGNFFLPNDLQAKGHEFHYSTFHSKNEIPYAYETKGMRGVSLEGYMMKNLVAGYTHFHFASCPEMVENWILKCKETKRYE
ncbi:cobyrinic acid a,c-diamide synthase [Anaerobacillus alkalidiazotrophicus]|uniref:Cobyrinate a,c-diamide synthase n=1 Tax=Anaerobacillus alkalidiazotrophicus TaxID=472963 RepID=A0A1S2M492_9BACI|nr:cobyrinate a,c-diamide synthase [Anaerobacillus alkalidiazotrophicus]OIJ19283.1 cobyrinic acid a,c-diamide synthase [Anaerobacillus alkalidiazotrophicus]